MRRKIYSELLDWKKNKHGLFSDSGKELDLGAEVEKLRQFDGNIFTVKAVHLDP